MNLYESFGDYDSRRFVTKNIAKWRQNKIQFSISTLKCILWTNSMIGRGWGDISLR